MTQTPLRLRPAVVAGEPLVITAIMQFSLPEPLTLEEATEVFRSTAPIYKGRPRTHFWYH